MGVEIRGLSRLNVKLQGLTKAIQQGSEDAIRELTEIVKSQATLRLQSSIKYSSGELAGSLKDEVVDSKGNLVGRVWSDKKQAIFREFGTGPVGQASHKELPPDVHPTYTQSPWFIPVEAVDRDLNAIYGIPKVKIQDKIFYITKGQPARPWLYPSLKDAEEQAPNIIKENVQKRIRGLMK